MKKSLFKLFSLCMFCIAALTYQSCESDPCEDVNCGTNGNCLEGKCLCDIGYTGSTCDLEQRTAFINSYESFENCMSDTIATDTTYLMQITPMEDSLNVFFIENIHNTTDIVVANITGDMTFDIKEQKLLSTDSTYVVGDGEIDGSNVSLNYFLTNKTLQITDSLYRDTCVAILTPL